MKNISIYRWFSLAILIIIFPFCIIVNKDNYDSMHIYSLLYQEYNDIYSFSSLQRFSCVFVLFLIFTIIITVFLILYFLNVWQKYHLTKIALISLCFFSAFLFPFYYMLYYIFSTTISEYIAQIILSSITAIGIIAIYIFVLIKEIKKLKSSNSSSVC